MRPLVAELVPDRTAALVLSASAGFGPLVLAEGACLPIVHELAVRALPRILSNRMLLYGTYKLFVTT